jgi:hypothetical protein
MFVISTLSCGGNIDYMNNERSSKKPKSKIEVVQKIKWPKEKEKTKE